MSRARLTSFISALLLAGSCAAPAVAKDSTIRQLYVFSCSSGGTCPNGEAPAALLLSSDGNFYGVTGNGGTGSNAAGTVFKLTSDFQLTTLHTFQSGNSSDGAFPTGLVEGSDGNLYGTTVAGGANDNGALFRLSKSGDFRLLHSLCASCGEGSDPEFLVKGSDGNFYGDSYGVLFQVTPDGKFTVLHTFDSATEGPDALGLVQASNGDFYGARTVLTSFFRLKPTGQFSILQTFHYARFPTTPPIQAADGRLYGILTIDAGHNAPGLFRSNLSAGKFADLSLQTNSRDLPKYLMQASDGTLWGEVFTGIDYPNGTLFGYSTKGKLLQQIVLDGSNGSNPSAPLIQAPDGTLIGIAYSGGTAANGDTAAGTVFAIQ